ncbi:G-protein coupled receptor moody-like [Bacillus rossius redtenbacheri]|uniref:G-protein coupled receptor moody-like n=1 Tax=Bacillus rossius redtenbacheri TaxID=93214 RepID=UPI002FDEBA33
MAEPAAANGSGEGLLGAADCYGGGGEVSRELFAGYSAALLHFASACCVVFVLVGVPGNLITIVALCRCKKVRNATAVFIINLSVSDLMFCCFNLPLATSMFWQRAWLHGELLCQLFPLLRYGLVAVSLVTVLAITINRYVMIGHPRMYPKLYSKKYLGLMVACTWVFGLGALVPTWLGAWGQFGLDRCIGSCTIMPDAAGRSPKEFLFVVAFLIPCLAIAVCYARIFYIVRETALKSRSNTVTAAAGLTAAGGGGRASRAAGKRFVSIAEDSAIGSSTGPSISTDKSSSACLENGHSSPPCNNNKAGHLRLEALQQSLEVPSPHLLSPPSPTQHHLAARFVGEPSSSGVDLEDCDEGLTTRSATPTSLCSSLGDPGRRRQTLTQVTALFRRGSQARRSARRPSALAASAAATPGKMTAKDKKLLKMILVIFASFVVCYLPITITKTFHESLDLHGLNVAGYLLIYLSTCINPIIYVVMSSEYRQAYKNLLVCRSHGGGSGGETPALQRAPGRA